MAKGDKVVFVAVPDMIPMAESVREILLADKFKLTEIIPIKLERFADGVSLPKITSTIRRKEVYLFYTPPLGQPDLGFAELSKILNAAHFASPRSIKVVLPHFWEGRADRKSEPRVSTNAKELAKIIEHYPSVDGLFTLDLHAEQIVLAFDRVPIDNLKGQVPLAAYALKVPGWTKLNVGVVAADVGGVKRAEKFAKRSGFPFKGLVYKERAGANVAVAKRYIGDSIDGLHVILPDDMVDTAGTILGAGTLLKGIGAASVTAATTQWLANPKDDGTGLEFITAEAKFRRAEIKVIALDTIPRSPEYLAANSDILTMVPCPPMIAYAIKASLTAESVSRYSE